MQSAAGGTNQRLKPAFAMVCSRSRIPTSAPDIVLPLLIVVIGSSPTAALACRAFLSPVVCYLNFAHRVQASVLLPRTIFERHRDREPPSRFQHPTRCLMP